MRKKENYISPYKYEVYEEMMVDGKWIKEIPFIQFPADWKVQIIPPFTGIVVRFRVQLEAF